MSAKLDTIAARVAHARIAAGFKSQPALARAVAKSAGVDVSPQAIQLIESGTTKRSRYLPDIAAATGFELEWLLNGKGPERSPQRVQQPKLIYSASEKPDPMDRVNADALRRALAMVEDICSEEEISIPSDLKASIVEVVYRILSRSGQADAGVVKNLLRLVK